MDFNTKVDEQLIYEGKWLHFKLLHFQVNGRQMVWEMIERPPGNRGGVDIIPIIKYKDKPSQVIVIANFRPPIRKFCLEFPAGIVDPDGSIQENGLREIKEETGYTAQIGQYQYNGVRIRNDPWKSTEYGLCVIADIDGDSEVNLNPKQHLESDENIIVYKVNMGKTMANEILQLAKEKDYEIAGLLWFFALGQQFNN
ncbi:unnamed protein product [Paramecium pentaurelia]|uniref:Nudix hydrolase domain-containing protein n=1 Tax=Paramecium pentaurelia TaxID=43138 RepID=A0A8S1WPJ4_9CILI|nr:unnamed protein product [Paramecium pentaurelia]